ncbi:hypothetical protein MYX76_06260 [Desulfobacterota bacterium AH_259_B03_O07]|nr:hypothetical protein [Desulfobacterota bacterium AH_259_B03_O07]
MNLTSIKYQRILSVNILLLISYLLQSCTVNLPAVREFSKATVASSSSFDGLVDDLPKSCFRRASFTLPGDKFLLEPPKFELELTDTYSNRLLGCDKYKVSVLGIVEAQNVLQNYAEALGKLASDDVVTFSTETAALKNALQSIDIDGQNPFNDARVGATMKIAEFIFNIAVKGYRQKKLKDTIEIGNENLYELVDGLNDFAIIYTKILESEKNTVKSYQKNVLKTEIINLNKQIDNLEKMGKRFDSLVGLLEVRRDQLKGEVFEAESSIILVEEKQSGAKDYMMILEKISSTHKQLYESRNDLDSQELIDLIKSYSQELIPLIKNIRHAFIEQS